MRLIASMGCAMRAFAAGVISQSAASACRRGDAFRVLVVRPVFGAGARLDSQAVREVAAARSTSLDPRSRLAAVQNSGRLFVVDGGEALSAGYTPDELLRRTAALDFSAAVLV